MFVRRAVLHQADCGLLTLEEKTLRLLGEPILKTRYLNLSSPKTPQRLQPIIASSAPRLQKPILGRLQWLPLHRPRLLPKKMHRR